jgi:glycosyltransferase involved in cell wall biosynthesis
MTDSRLITVVIALKNDATGLRTTLASIAGQEGASRVGVLVVDANSRDAPVEVVEAFRSALHIDFHASFDRGIYNAWNKALEWVNTPWLTFFGAGDTFCPGAIAALVGRVAGDPPVDVVSSRSRNIFSLTRHVIGGEPFDYERFKRHFSVNHSGLLYRHALFGRFGNFDERYRSSGDYEFLIRVGQRLRFDFLDMIVSDYIVGGISSSSTMPLRETYQVRRAHRLTGRLDNLRQLARAYAAFYKAKLLS